MIRIALLLGFLGCSFASGEVPAKIREFVRKSLAGGDSRYLAELDTSGARYFLFWLQQRDRTGVALVQDAGRTSVIVSADTAIDPLPIPEPDSSDLARQVANLLQRLPPSSLNCPGTEIDRVVGPIAGFYLHTNATREILRKLRESSALPIDPKRAPPGSVFVAPTRFQTQGPIELGAAGILGSDGYIYAASAFQRWSRVASRESWLDRYQAANGVFAFVLRAGKPVKNLELSR